MLSIDTKKKEILGNFRPSGQAWTDGRVRVFDQDFVANEGLMLLARGADTCRLTCDAIWRWWQRLGRRHYAFAPRLLLLGDCGGSNGSAWLLEVQSDRASDVLPCIPRCRRSC